jgi:DNA-binding IclR family transcriptional regulator
MSEKRAGQDRVFAVERALMLLQCFGNLTEKRTLASLSRESGLYKSTILRLAGSLCRMGFLQRDGKGTYSLGPELKRLGSLGRSAVEPEAVIRPVLLTLTAVTKETASFYVRDGRHRICLFREVANRDLRHHLDEGARHPLDSGAAGKVLRAYSKHAKDPELALVRRWGWAMSRGERDPDLGAIAVPIFSRDKELLGALQVSGLLSHFTAGKERPFKEALIRGSRQVTAGLRRINVRSLVTHLALQA